MKQRQSRREFISLMTAVTAGVVSRGSLGSMLSAQALDPDLVVFNAKVYTMDSRNSGETRLETPATTCEHRFVLNCQLQKKHNFHAILHRYCAS